MNPNPLAGFFSEDPDAVAAALARLASPDAPERERRIEGADVPFAPGVHVRKNGLWSTDLFGPEGARDPDAWAVIELPTPFFHPALGARIAGALGLTEPEVIAIVHRRAWLTEDGRARVPPGHPGVSSTLTTELSDWPPNPGFPTVETWRARLKLPDDAAYEPWLAEWYRERGIDQAAFTAAGDAWKEEAEARTGIDTLLSALAEKLGPDEAEKLVLRRVPAPPVTERPLERRPGGFFATGARSRALADIVHRSARAHRLIELNAPPVIVSYERGVIQRMIEGALAVWSGRRAEDLSRYEDDIVADGEPPAAPTWPVPEQRSALTCVRGVALADARRALVDFPTATFEVDLETGAVLRRWRSPGRALLACLSGRFALYTGAMAWDFGCFDMDAGAWVKGPLPPEVPFVFLELHEQSFLVEVATRRVHHLDEIGDYPTRLLISPCGRYLFATDKHGSAAVFRADGETQFPVELYDRTVPVLWPSGKLKAATARQEQNLSDRWGDELTAFALCEARDTWRRVQASGFVEGFDLKFRFACSIEAACFNRDATEILAVGKNELFRVALDPEPRLCERLDLRPLSSLFVGAPPGKRPKAEALNALLFKYGTLTEAARAPVSEIAALNTACAYDEPQILGPKKAKRLLEAARRVNEVSALPRIG